MKARWSLLPLDSVEEVVKVFTFGAAKYSDFGWVTEPKQKYFDAAMRHIKQGMSEARAKDWESGLPALAHAVTDLLIYMELERRESNA